MYTELAAHGEGAGNLLPALTRMRNAIDAAQASATRISRFNEGVVLFTMVVYAGEDQAARQASAIVVGDLLGRDLLQEHVVDVKLALSGVGDTIRYGLFLFYNLI
jgi:hypothetical protein